MTSSHPERARRRASDADRERVVETLRGAAEDGRLDMSEFDQRMDEAYQAKTFGELEPLLEDLEPVEFSSDSPSRGRAAVEPSHRTELTLGGTGSSIRRTGRWRVPARVLLTGNMGSTWLDLTEAEFESSDVEFHLNTSMGTVTLVVPPGTEVDRDDLHSHFGTIHVRLRDDDVPTTRRIRLTGQCTMGSVIVRGPGFLARWRRRRSSAR